MAKKRILKELRLASVPLDSEEGRALLQERLALFARATAFVSFCFLVVGNLMTVSLAGIRPALVFAHKPNWLHFAAVCVCLSVWLIARRGQRGARALFWLDLGGTLLSMVLYAGMAALSFVENKQRVDLVLLLITLMVMLLRATIVPSTPRQTTLITALSSAPVIGVAALVGSEAPTMAETWGAPISTALWCAATTFSATLASRVIYGLRARAADAERLGQYLLEAKIGEGGMGSVYRARHALLRRPTAIKLLPLDKAGEQAVTRFEREVQHTSRLTHPNTVAIYDYGRTPDGVFYYAMEYLDGLDLQELVERYGPQPPARVVHILTQVCGALAEAHEHGIVHRDVKPANVILCDRGGIPDVAKVLDFGLAKDLSANGDAKLSNVNAIIGTPLYMPPEAITSPDNVDDRSDLYALGAVGYFLLSGEPVFAGGSLVEVCGKHLHQAPDPPSSRLGKELPGDLERLVLSCLAKKKDERPATARALRAALLECAVEPWTEDRARAWWAENQARARHSAQDNLAGGPTVLAVDLATRAVD